MVSCNSMYVNVRFLNPVFRSPPRSQNIWNCRHRSEAGSIHNSLQTPFKAWADYLVPGGQPAVWTEYRALLPPEVGFRDFHRCSFNGRYTHGGPPKDLKAGLAITEDLIPIAARKLYVCSPRHRVGHSLGPHLIPLLREWPKLRLCVILFPGGVVRPLSSIERGRRWMVSRTSCQCATPTASANLQVRPTVGLSRRYPFEAHAMGNQLKGSLQDTGTSLEAEMPV